MTTRSTGAADRRADAWLRHDIESRYAAQNSGHSHRPERRDEEPAVGRAEDASSSSAQSL